MRVVTGAPGANRVPDVCFARVSVFLAVALLSTACRPSAPAPPVSLQPHASVTFLGYTNDASGIRLASFAVTNQSQIAVVREAKYLICGEMPLRGWAPMSGGLLPRGRVLKVGSSEIVSIKPPVTQTAWRVTFYIRNDFGMKRLIRATQRFLGRPSKYPSITYGADSPRIESQLQSDFQRLAKDAGLPFISFPVRTSAPAGPTR